MRISLSVSSFFSGNFNDPTIADCSTYPYFPSSLLSSPSSFVCNCVFYYELHKKAGKSHELLCLPHCHRALAINNNISICQIALLILFSLCTFCRPSSFSPSSSLFFTGQAHFPGRQRTPDSTYYVLKLRTQRPFACLGLCVLYCYRACNQPQYNECACMLVCMCTACVCLLFVCVCGKCETCPLPRMLQTSTSILSF